MGTDTGEYWNTWKFVEVFADKAACVAAYAGNGGAAAPATEPQPVQTSFDTANSPEYQTALKFARTIVLGICKGKAAADLGERAGHDCHKSFHKADDCQVFYGWQPRDC